MINYEIKDSTANMKNFPKKNKKQKKSTLAQKETEIFCQLRCWRRTQPSNNKSCETFNKYRN